MPQTLDCFFVPLDQIFYCYTVDKIKKIIKRKNKFAPIPFYHNTISCLHCMKKLNFLLSNYNILIRNIFKILYNKDKKNVFKKNKTVEYENNLPIYYSIEICNL